MGSPPGYEFPFDTPEPGSRTAAIIILVLANIYYPSILTLAFLRRKSRFWAARGLEGALVTGLVFFLMTWVNCLSLIFGKEPFCWPMVASIYIFLCFSVFYILDLPSFLISADCNAAKLRRARAKDDSALAWKLSWYFSYRAKFLYVCILVVVHGGLLALLYLKADIKGDCVREPLLLFVGEILLYMIFFIPMFPKLVKLKDPFHFKLEIFWGLLAGLPNLVIIILYPIAPEVFPTWFDYRWNFITMGLIYGLWDIAFPTLLTFPRFLSWIERRRRNVQEDEEHNKEMDRRASLFASKKGLDLFTSVLLHDRLREAFTQFMVHEWCVENILFYQAVEEFKGLCERDLQAAAVLAREIVKEYVSFSAALEVNIDSGTRRKILSEAQKDSFPLAIFDAAQREVFEIMNRSSFARWKETSDFKEVMESVIEASSKRKSFHGSIHQGSKFEEE